MKRLCMRPQLRWKATMEHDHENGESAASLERRREALLRKAKEYHKELEALMVRVRNIMPNI